MKKTKKEAKFFCESCGSEVPRRSKTCPKCGKFFCSVRCPKCGKTGTNDDFKNGCPDCGYAFHPEASGYKKSSNIKIKTSSKPLHSSIFNKRQKSKYVESSLPSWIYISSFSLLVILIICLYSCLYS